MNGGLSRLLSPASKRGGLPSCSAPCKEHLPPAVPVTAPPSAPTSLTPRPPPFPPLLPPSCLPLSLIPNDPFPRSNDPSLSGATRTTVGSFSGPSRKTCSQTVLGAQCSADVWGEWETWPAPVQPFGSSHTTSTQNGKPGSLTCSGTESELLVVRRTMAPEEDLLLPQAGKAQLPPHE